MSVNITKEWANDGIIMVSSGLCCFWGAKNSSSVKDSVIFQNVLTKFGTKKSFSSGGESARRTHHDAMRLPLLGLDSRPYVCA